MIRYALALALIAGPAAALELALPVDCEMGARCYIQRYVDRDAGPDSVDYTCGSLTSDGHNGTDFRVATLAESQKGVAILAAAPGRVRAVRDGVQDLGTDYAPDGKECGNGVVIAHGDGWETQYCHLREGSVAVAVGAPVATGDKLGLMGLSGDTQFPHLQFSVRKGGETIDPFDARNMAQACGLPADDSLWSPGAREQLMYRSGGLVDLGLTNEAPTLSAISAGYPTNSARSDGPAMILWARFYGLRKNDVLSLILFAPDGRLISRHFHRMPKHRAEELRYTGRKGSEWTAGDYRAVISITRDGKIQNVSTGRFVVP